MSEILTIKEATAEFKSYVGELKNGYKPGILTSYDNLNKVLRGGIPKNTVTLIAAHSGRGKTALALNLALDTPRLNENTAVYIFSLEMPHKDLIARAISRASKKTVSDMYDNLDDINFESIDNLQDLDITIDTRTGTANAIGDRINNFMQNKTDKDVLVVLDHSLLLLANADRDKTNKLSEICNHLKLKWKNLSIIVISQLNDAFLKEDRMKAKGVGMFPGYNDLYEGRQLYQVANTVICLNLPSDYIDEELNATKDKLFRKEYGGLPMFNYGMTKQPLIYAHIIKGRDTGTSIVSFVNLLQFNEFIPVPVQNR